jgi:transposase
LTTVWADTGSRPTAPKQGGFKSLHILTTVCPATGRAEGLICERLNTAIVQMFLDQLSATIPVGTHVALIWDNAGYHTSKALRSPKNITLVRLPPYSPELNPVENLWHYLRCHYWSNRTYQDLDAVEDAAVDGWRKACLDTKIIKSVCACPYLEKRG